MSRLESADIDRGTAHRHDDRPEGGIGAGERRSTRLAFLVAGLGMAAWAPLVPYAKHRLNIGEGTLGLLLLAIGLGSLIAMPLAGSVSARYGCRRVILASGAGIVLVLPWLAVVDHIGLMALALFLFGASVGTIDVAMNIQAVIVEKASGRALMSGFHGFYSIGGMIGAAAVSLLLWRGVAPLTATLGVSAVLVALLAWASGRLLRQGDDGHGDGAWLVLPHGPVILIGLLCLVMFLAEGAMLDWSALLLVSWRGIEPSVAGAGYAVFAVAMTIGRFNGDRIILALGARRVFLVGSLCAAIGFLLAALVPSAVTTWLGFALIGLGASNVVPILFSAAGRQQAMPMGLAISAVSTMGYAGILAGPAAIGWVAQITSLPAAFAGLGVAALFVAANTRVAGTPRET